MKDPYQILGVPETATDEEVKKAYLKRYLASKRREEELRLSLEALETELAEYTDIVKIPCSSVKGDGIEAVKAEIEKVC